MGKKRFNELKEFKPEKWKSTRIGVAKSEAETFERLNKNLPTLLENYTFDKKDELSENFDKLKLNRNATEVDEICDNLEIASEIAYSLDDAYSSSTKVPGNPVSKELISSLNAIYDFLNILIVKILIEIGYASIVELQPLDKTNYNKVKTGLSAYTYLKNRLDEIDPIPKTEDDEAADEDTEDSETETDEEN